MKQFSQRWLSWLNSPRLRWVLRWEVCLRARLIRQGFSPSARRRLRELRAKRDLWMNLGSGESGRKGWVNVDANRFEGVDLVWDLREPLPLPDGCAQCILSEHVLEHLGYPAEATAFLKECRRLLRTGGVLRLLVPDALKYCRVLVGGDWEGARRLRHVEGCRTLMEMVNDVFRQRYEHQFAYDEETLKLVLKDAGFSEVRRMNYGESRMEGLAAEQQWRAEESLCVEAVKGA